MLSWCNHFLNASYNAKKKKNRFLSIKVCFLTFSLLYFCFCFVSRNSFKTLNVGNFIYCFYPWTSAVRIEFSFGCHTILPSKAVEVLFYSYFHFISVDKHWIFFSSLLYYCWIEWRGWYIYIYILFLIALVPVFPNYLFALNLFLYSKRWLGKGRKKEKIE